MQDTLRTFLQTGIFAPCTLKVNENIELLPYSSNPISGHVFLYSGGMDEGAGGGVISAHIENIRHCIVEKSSNIKQYKSRYEEWWLYLVCYMELGLDYGIIEDVKSAISNIGEFNKVVILNYTGESWLFDISPK